MNLSPEKQIEQNIDCCENIISILETVEDSDINQNQANIILKILLIRQNTEELKELYKNVVIPEDK